MVCAKEYVENRNVAAIVLRHQVVMVDVVAWHIETLPVSEHSQHHIKEWDGFANKEVRGEQQVTQEAARHCHPELYNVVKCKVCDANHVLRTIPSVVIRVAKAP